MTVCEFALVPLYRICYAPATLYTPAKRTRFGWRSEEWITVSSSPLEGFSKAGRGSMLRPCFIFSLVTRDRSSENKRYFGIYGSGGIGTLGQL